MRFFGRSWAIFLFLSIIWFSQRPVLANSLPCRVGVAESAIHLSNDLDADRKPDSVFFRSSGAHNSIEVHLTSNRKRVHLAVPFRGETGFQLIAYDVDHDRRDDLILTNGSSIIPVALWLNKGNGSFERTPETLAPLFGSGFEIQLQRGTSRGDSPVAISTDDSPKVFQILPRFQCDLESTAWAGHHNDSLRKSPSPVFSSPRSPPQI